jgi:hypothetical protein
MRPLRTPVVCEVRRNPCGGRPSARSSGRSVDGRDRINPHVDSEASADLVLEAHEHFAAVRVEHARLTRERRQAETAWLLARATVREGVRTTCHARKRQLVARLSEALTLAATASREIEEIENSERAHTGPWYLSGFAWSELSAPSSAQGSRLDEWQAAARAAALLD